eukprot:scaffold137874_cov30-Tisochrysis_lutea.AAC.2
MSLYFLLPPTAPTPSGDRLLCWIALALVVVFTGLERCVIWGFCVAWACVGEFAYFQASFSAIPSACATRVSQVFFRGGGRRGRARDPPRPLLCSLSPCSLSPFLPADPASARATRRVHPRQHAPLTRPARERPIPDTLDRRTPFPCLHL